MFTGIVEGLGEVRQIVADQTNIHYRLSCRFTHELKVDQSLSHNGVCLTVTRVENDFYWVTAIQETLDKTDLKSWEMGTKVNLERCMPANGRFDGHIVQGHVDQIGICESIQDHNGSWKFTFSFNQSTGNLTVTKGSICINGVSLTVVDSGWNYFSVAIIPYTFENTNFRNLKVGNEVNLEFDIVGKYIRKMMDQTQQKGSA